MRRSGVVMTAPDTSFDPIAQEVRNAIDSAGDASDALERAVAILKARIPHYTWVGVYLLEGDELVLGPYRGAPSPHTRIPLGRGICGAAAISKATIIVDDVGSDTRYLACSVDTRSEIVVPIMRGATVLGEIDIDSNDLAAFGDADRRLLETIAHQLAEKL